MGIKHNLLNFADIPASGEQEAFGLDHVRGKVQRFSTSLREKLQRSQFYFPFCCQRSKVYFWKVKIFPIFVSNLSLSLSFPLLSIYIIILRESYPMYILPVYLFSSSVRTNFLFNYKRFFFIFDLFSLLFLFLFLFLILFLLFHYFLFYIYFSISFLIFLLLSFNLFYFCS